MLYMSGTADCAAYSIPDTNVWLIDTPGFDDTYRSDAKILEEINRCLSEYFHKDAKVTGVLYVHAITEARMRGSAMKNLRMFRQVVGSNNMSHCCLVTTKWSKQSEDLSRSREAELQTNDTFWKPLVDRGAHIMQFKDSLHSAMDIIRPFTRCPRFIMKLTLEYNVEGKKLDKTEAGKEVFDDLEQAQKEHQEEIEALREDRKMALDAKDKQMLEMIEKERVRLQKEMDDMKAGQQLLQKKLADEKQELVQKLERDRLIRENDKEHLKNKLMRGAARAGAVGVAAGAIFFSGGIATPAAVLFLAGVEGSLQDQKDSETSY
jgi:hypothetical protein